MAAHSFDRRVFALALVVRVATAAALLSAVTGAQGEPPTGELDVPPLLAEVMPELAPVDLAAPDSAWASLFADLAAKQPLFATFTEIRRFPFKKDAVQLVGEMRFDRELGLSLHYREPDDRTLIADRDGILMRDARGRSRALRPGRRGAPAPASLLSILAFDLENLARFFEVRGARTGDLWWLEFKPREEAPATRVSAIQVAGEQATVKHIGLMQETGQFVQIVVDSARAEVAFTQDEIRQWFR